MCISQIVLFLMVLHILTEKTVVNYVYAHVNI